MLVVNVAAGIIIRQGNVLLAKRPDNKHQGGLWEFPGGKIETGESAEQALVRELQEEINIQVQQLCFFEEISFKYTDKNVCLQFFKVSEFDGVPIGLEGQQIKWVSISDLANYPFPPANTSIVSKIQQSSITD